MIKEISFVDTSLKEDIDLSERKFYTSQPSKKSFWTERNHRRDNIVLGIIYKNFSGTTSKIPIEILKVNMFRTTLVKEEIEKKMTFFSRQIEILRAMSGEIIYYPDEARLDFYGYSQTDRRKITVGEIVKAIERINISYYFLAGYHYFRCPPKAATFIPIMSK